jgi:hypothetical protein
MSAGKRNSLNNGLALCNSHISSLLASERKKVQSTPILHESNPSRQFKALRSHPRCIHPAGAPEFRLLRECVSPVVCGTVPLFVLNADCCRGGPHRPHGFWLDSGRAPTHPEVLHQACGGCRGCGWLCLCRTCLLVRFRPLSPAWSCSLLVPALHWHLVAEFLLPLLVLCAYAYCQDPPCNCSLTLAWL